ncbi:Chaperone protein DnaJ {ECO:0000255/HAMAP-Rule:MF_01152} [Methanothermobacter wolfeii]|uniref:Chaperone protein DnaJ n=1 Tax=Methanothermobacter wolfeii TaxID=145261 RepID=A0A9E7RSU1_METWO|nr:MULTISPECIES: molecular chaperone DnaJ [Methanothermobacter]NLM02219.1 molecular chaperone DnaJ [Methanothermobacter wolfeii]QHN07005.1 molecular chaperone DnaJ [Methanothermobacter sp. THM-1]UXH31601.1 molecular chaperone DnaJ [Methanothermobacter wolfeii]SCM58516.1 Chaperone protein DnaJ {ECO:0000255/HAMAP-Rule:MF_01152} [Methanothermobacter wolfeii]
MAKRDYYEVLGVDRGADKKEIKRAYRRLAKKYHPDVSDDPAAAEKFKEISEAYAVLSDDEKRRRYDQFGHAGMDGFSQEDIFSNINFEDIFSGLGFDVGNIFDMFGFGRGRRRGPQRGADLEYTLEISLEDAYRGLETDIRVPHTKKCPVCKGTRAEPGTGTRTCSTCGGSGQVRQVRNTILGQMMNISTCPDCQGEGTVVEKPCSNCNGRGIVKKTSTIHVKIPPGVETGSRLRIPCEGEMGLRGGQPGDLYVVIKVKPHRIFERDGANLYTEKPISFVQAALGDTVKVPTLDRPVKLRIPAGTQSGTTFRVKGHGMPHLKWNGYGNLYVKVKVVTPRKLSSRQKELLKEFASISGDEIHDDKGFFDKVKDAIIH